MDSKEEEIKQMSQEYTIFEDFRRRSYFFSSSYGQDLGKMGIISEQFITTTFKLPMSVVPRPGLSGGVIETLDQYMEIFQKGAIQRPNPDPKYEPTEKGLLSKPKLGA